MAQMLPQAIHEGMRVFAGADEIGRVTAVREHSMEVTRGLFNRHVYLIPRKYVVEADGDIVDLAIPKEQVDGLELHPEAEPAELPDEFRQVEGIESPTASRIDEDDYFRR